MNFDYSLVIATMQRPEPLHEALTSLSQQSVPPTAVVVVDASPDDRTLEVCRGWEGRLPVRWLKAEARSAARQRNQGASRVTTPLIGFMDDDVVLPIDTLAKLVAPFSAPETGGVAGRIEGMTHPVPRGLLWCYYRLQAGYSHPHYGGRVIGPGINLLPAFAAETHPLVPAEWLNSTLVLYRRELFEREKFPAFEGYSFLEDAHLSHRIGRTHRLYFHRDAPYVHNSQPSSAKADRAALARMIVRHQRKMAREVLGLRGPALWWKLTLHRVFQTIAVLRSSTSGRWASARGFWSA